MFVSVSIMSEFLTVGLSRVDHVHEADSGEAAAPSRRAEVGCHCTLGPLLDAVDERFSGLAVEVA